MNLPIRTTSPTGNKNGFTFVEVMVALVVLTGGIVFIYRSFFICVDYFSRLSLRLHASELVDERISDVTRLFHQQGDLNFDRGPLTISEEMNHRLVDFNYEIQINPIEENPDMLRLQVAVSWLDAGHLRKFTRTTSLSL